MSGSSAGATASAELPPPGALEGVLFDMDGLLVDSEPLWFETERVIMARMGSDWSDADQEYLIGGSLRRSVGYMLGKAARPVAPELLAHWLVDGMAQVIRERGVPVKPGAARLLAEVTAAAIPSALVTSAERAIMEATLAATGLRFTAQVCAQDVTRPKPDPEPYQRAAAAVGADPRRCVALDDSPTGVSSAEAAGCVVIAVPSVPLPPRPGRLTVASLCEVNLGTLRERLASQQPALGQA